MADLSAMRGHLGRIRQEVLSSPVFQSGRPDSGDKAAVESQRFGRMAGTVVLIVRELNSAQSLIRMREQGLRKTPRDHRYALQQSIAQQSENVRLLLDDAQGLADSICDLLERNGVLNPFQQAKGMLDLIKELEKNAGKDAQTLVSQVVGATKQDVISPAHPGGADVSVGGVLNLIVFIYLGLKVMQKRLQ